MRRRGSIAAINKILSFLRNQFAPHGQKQTLELIMGYSYWFPDQMMHLAQRKLFTHSPRVFPRRFGNPTAS